MKNWKIYIVLASLLITIGAVIFAHYQYRETQKAEAEVAVIKMGYQAEAKLLAQKIDKDGIQHTILDGSANVITTDDVKKAKNIENLVDTAATAMGVQADKITELTTIKIKHEATMLEMKGIIDSLSRMVYYYTDQYINAKFTPTGQNTGLLDYTYKVDLSHNKYVIGNKSYVEIYTNDKRATIEGVKRLVIESPVPTTKKNAISAYGGTYYDVAAKTLGIGPGAKLDIGNFQLKGTYTFFPSTSHWSPIVNLDYNLYKLRF